MTFSTLKSTVAIIALTTGAALAQSSADAEMETAETNAEAAAQSAENTLENTGDSIGAASEAAVEYIENAAESAGDAIDQAADHTADAVSDAYDATADALSDVTESTENAAEEAYSKTAEGVSNVAEETGDVAASAANELDEAADGISTASNALEAEAEQMGQVDASMSDMTVGDLLGKDVVEASGEEIGEINNIVRENNELSAIVGIGGFLGLGKHNVAIPVSEFQVSADDADDLTLAKWSRDELKRQPEFNDSGVESLPADTRLNPSS